jgi:hypothetical protein
MRNDTYYTLPHHTRLVAHQLLIYLFFNND